MGFHNPFRKGFEYFALLVFVASALVYKISVLTLVLFLFATMLVIMAKRKGLFGSWCTVLTKIVTIIVLMAGGFVVFDFMVVDKLAFPSYDIIPASLLLSLVVGIELGGFAKLYRLLANWRFSQIVNYVAAIVCFVVIYFVICSEPFFTAGGISPAASYSHLHVSFLLLSWLGFVSSDI